MVETLKSQSDSPHRKAAPRSKILMLTGTFPKFSETFIFLIAKNLVKKGNQVDFLVERLNQDALTKSKAYQDFTIQAYIYRLWKGKDKWLFNHFKFLIHLPKIAWYLHKNRKRLHYTRDFWPSRFVKYLIHILNCYPERSYDIVHVQFGNFLKFFQILDDLKIIRYRSLVVSFRGYDATALLQSLPGFYRPFLSRIDKALPVSASLKAILLQEGFQEENISILRTPIDVKKFTFDPLKRLNKDKLQLVAVGRLVEKKGFHLLLEALAKNPLKGRSQLRIVGDGPLKSALIVQIHDLGLKDQVQFLGPMAHDQLIDLVRTSDVLIAPSIRSKNGDMEGIPNVIKEAMLLGTLVIASDHSGIPELVEDGKTGFLAREGHVDSLIEKFNELLNVEEPFLKEMRITAREKVVTEYDISQLNEQLIKEYEALLLSHKERK